MQSSGLLAHSMMDLSIKGTSPLNRYSTISASRMYFGTPLWYSTRVGSSMQQTVDTPRLTRRTPGAPHRRSRLHSCPHGSGLPLLGAGPLGGGLCGRPAWCWVMSSSCPTTRCSRTTCGRRWDCGTGRRRRCGGAGRKGGYVFFNQWGMLGWRGGM